jgi:hypothetical protein
VRAVAIPYDHGFLCMLSHGDSKTSQAPMSKPLTLVVMKTLSILICLQIIYCLSFSQVDRKTSLVLEKILRKDHPVGTLVYTDMLDKFAISDMKESLGKKVYIGRTASLTYDTLKLSKAEVKYVDSILRTLPTLYWQDSIFAESRRIPKDSLWSWISKQNKKSYDDIVKATSDSLRKLANKAWMTNANTFQFSMPIFLRKKTIFFFYYMRICGSLCGVTDLSVYRLENGVYKKWFLISGSVF